MNLLLVILAALLVTLIIPVAVLFELSTLSYKKINKWFFDIAVSIDQFSNVFCRHILNKALAKGGAHLFGCEDETVSSVIGKNKESGTLTKTGKFIADTLNKLQNNHVEAAIEKDENFKK